MMTPTEFDDWIKELNVQCKRAALCIADNRTPPRSPQWMFIVEWAAVQKIIGKRVFYQRVGLTEWVRVAEVVRLRGRGKRN